MTSNFKSQTESTILECVDHSFPGDVKRRVVVDAGRREVTFINCLWPRRFFARGYEHQHCYPFSDILSAREFGAGQLRRLYIGTSTGRCVVAPDWTGYDELVKALKKISSVTTGARWLDDPRILMPVMLVAIFGIVGAIIYFLL